MSTKSHKNLILDIADRITQLNLALMKEQDAEP